MKIFSTLLVSASLALTAFAADEAGFKPLFNGKDLTGWEGRKEHWTVEDGCITGTTTKENPAKGNNFLIAKAGGKNLIVGDFELRLSYKFSSDWGNSGIQYRSKEFPDFVVGGYQADFEVGKTYSGILYEERGRGILAQRGQKVVLKDGDGEKPKIEVTGSLGKTEDIQAKIHVNDWNEYVVIAKGNHLQHFINGKPTVDVTDECEAKAAKSGVLALQIHAGPPMTIQFKDIRIKTLSAASATASDLDRVQGDWIVAEVVANGEKVPADTIANAKLKIKGDKYDLDAESGASRGTLKLREKENPKAMDVTTDDGTEVAAIYELSEDSMKVCYALNGALRPKEFKSASGSDHVFTIYKRKAK